MKLSTHQQVLSSTVVRKSKVEIWGMNEIEERGYNNNEVELHAKVRQYLEDARAELLAINKHPRYGSSPYQTRDKCLFELLLEY